MGSIKKVKKSSNTFLTFFMSASFVVLFLIVLVGGFFIFSGGKKANADSFLSDEIIIDTAYWEENIPLMKQVADNLNLRYKENSSAEDLKNLLSKLTNKDVENITDIVLVNQQLTHLPEVLSYFGGMKRINLSGNQLLDLPDYLKNGVEVIADNNILPDSYNMNNQYQLYLLEVMKEEYGKIKIDSRYDENQLKDLAQQSLWVTASLPKGGHSFAPLNGHNFSVEFLADVDGLGGSIDKYIDSETNEVIKTGKVFGEFFLEGSTNENKNARFSFSAELSNSEILPVKVRLLEENMEISSLIAENLGLKNASEISKNMLSSLKELRIKNNIEKIPEIFNLMTSLESLDFTRYEGDSISKEFLALDGITNINLSNINNTALINSLVLPKNIKSVDLSNNNLIEIPNAVLKNTNLESINFSNNLLVKFDQNKEVYNLDGNLLSDEYESQRKITVSEDFNENPNTLELEKDEIINHILEFTSIENGDVSALKFKLINGESAEIDGFSSEEDVFLAVDGADIENKNATYKITNTDIEEPPAISSGFETSDINSASEEKEEENILEESINNGKAYVDYESLKDVLGENTPPTILINTEHDAVVKKEALEAIKNNNKSLKISRNIKGSDVLKYTFTIEPETLKETADLNLEIYFLDNVKPEIDNIVKAFKYSGDILPEGTILDIELKNIDNMAQYYLYNNIEEKLEYSGAIMVADGIMSLVLSGPNTYFISKDLINEATGNPTGAQDFEITPLRVILIMLGIVIIISFIWGGRKLFSKKEFGTKMPLDKTYTNEYNNYVKNIDKKDDLIKYDTMEFESITPEIISRYSGRANISTTLESLSLYDDLADFNSTTSDTEARYDGLEEHFGNKSNFKRVNKKGVVAYIDEKDFNKKENSKNEINKNNFDEYKLDL